MDIKETMKTICISFGLMVLWFVAMWIDVSLTGSLTHAFVLPIVLYGACTGWKRVEKMQEK